MSAFPAFPSSPAAPATTAMHQKASLRIVSDPPEKSAKPAQPPASSKDAPRTTGRENPFALKPIHQQAIALLVKGRTETHVANALGINRSTLYRWRTANPIFQAALNKLRQENWLAAQERLRSLFNRATAVLGKALSSKNSDKRFRAAHAFLVHAAPRDLTPSSDDPTRAMQIIDAQVLARRQLAGDDLLEPITMDERTDVFDSLFKSLNAPDDES